MHQLCVFYLPPPFQLGALPTPSSPLSESLSVQTQCNRAPSQTEGKVQVTFPEKGENEKECKGESAKQSKKAVSADLLIVRHPFCRPSNPIPRYFKIKILHVACCSGSEVKNQSKSESGAQCAKKECLFPAPTPLSPPGSPAPR